MAEVTELLVDGLRLEPDPSWTVAWVPAGSGEAVIRRGDDRERVLVEGGPERWVVVIRGRRIEVLTPSRRQRLLAEARGISGRRHGAAEVRATLPGLVVRVAVAAGDVVAEGDPLLIIEAMKMQNEIRAPRAGRVSAVEVAAGQPIAAGAVLVRLADPDP